MLQKDIKWMKIKIWKQMEHEDQSDSAIDVRGLVQLSTKVNQLTIKTEANLQKVKTDMKQELQEVKENFKKEVTQEMEKTLKHYEDEFKKLKEEVQFHKKRHDLVCGILQYNQQITKDIVKRLDNLETSNAKKMATLTGIKFSDKKEDLIRELTDLFQDELSVYDVKIQDAYKLGDNVPQPVVIIFETVTDKQKVFQNKKLLNRIHGEDEARIFLNDYLPAAQNEKRKRERDIKKEYAGNDKMKCEYTKKGFLVGSSVYKKKVQVPTSTELLELTPDDYDELMKMKLSKGPQMEVKGNIFIAYGLDCTDFRGIRDAYLKLKIMHTKARHIICAYNLPGVERHLLSDYVDDDDPGAARILLLEMLRSEIINKAIFVVRFCGEKLHGDRISSYLNAARENAGEVSNQS